METAGTETKTSTRVFNVAILTPYLTESFNRVAMSANDLKEQINKYGYDPKNLAGLSAIGTDKGNMVFLRTPEYIDGTMRQSINPQRVRDLTLVIAGSTEPGEEEVREMKGSGVIVARYSIFYGGNSQYTGRSPEASGYSLDIPKSVKSAMALITSDETLEALAEGDEFGIRSALERVNSRLERPILVTPYLKEALSY